MAAAYGWAGGYEQGLSCYRQGRISCAQQLLREVIASGQLKGPSLAKAYFYLGLCYLGAGDETGARQCFCLAREAAPHWEPDPLEMAPKAMRLWKAAGGRH